jgi:hypothetical protein
VLLMWMMQLQHYMPLVQPLLLLLQQQQLVYLVVRQAKMLRQQSPQMCPLVISSAPHLQ